MGNPIQSYAKPMIQSPCGAAQRSFTPLHQGCGPRSTSWSTVSRHDRRYLTLSASLFSSLCCCSFGLRCWLRAFFVFATSASSQAISQGQDGLGLVLLDSWQVWALRQTSDPAGFDRPISYSKLNCLNYTYNHGLNANPGLLIERIPKNIKKPTGVLFRWD